LTVTTEHIRYCQICGKTTSYKSKYEYNRAVKKNTNCKTCAYKNAVKKKRYQEISIGWFDAKKRRAAERNKEWDITIEYLWRIYIKQGKVCALSGLPLDFDTDSENGTVSIDRVNNDKGYVKRNIQLIHKDLNYMKYVYDQKYFIKMCKLVAEKHK
jgi:hypothetical protein